MKYSNIMDDAKRYDCKANATSQLKVYQFSSSSSLKLNIIITTVVVAI